MAYATAPSSQLVAQTPGLGHVSSEPGGAWLQKLAAQREAFVQALRPQAGVVVRLTPPPIPRVEVAVDGAPFRGLPTAPVTIVEFTDVHCPFCKRVLTTLTQLLCQYRDQVTLIFRDFAIDRLHPGARKSHEAARCASEQEKFWAYHDALYAHAPKATPEPLNRVEPFDDVLTTPPLRRDA